MNEPDSIETKLAQALAECERLREENRQLKQRLGIVLVATEISTSKIDAESNCASAAITSKSSPEEKVKLFRELFRGREDIYAVRWEGRNG